MYMKEKKIKIILATIFVIIVAIVSFYYLQSKSRAINYNTKDNSLEAKVNAMNQAGTEEINKEVVATYIRDHISTLSPEEAVLGGTFYVTKINFIDDNSAIVSYEDGHIALEAKAIFYINEDQVFIDSFELLKE